MWESLRDLVLRALSKEYGVQFNIKRGSNLQYTDKLVLLPQEANPGVKVDW